MVQKPHPGDDEPGRPMTPFERQILDRLQMELAQARQEMAVHITECSATRRAVQVQFSEMRTTVIDRLARQDLQRVVGMIGIGILIIAAHGDNPKFLLDLLLKIFS